jgi:hypothetical protein
LGMQLSLDESNKQDLHDKVVTFVAEHQKVNIVT